MNAQQCCFTAAARSPAAPATEVPAGLVLRGLGVSYGSKAVVRDIDLAPLPTGCVVAMVGANGAGKSSTLRALAGLNPMSGQALLDGDDLAALDPATRARRVAYMPQSLPQASSLTVYESVLSAVRTACPQLGTAVVHQRIETVLGDLGLRDLAMRPLLALSGGQRQMAGLAQLLVREPRLLLLDEPTSALDLRWQLCLMEALRRHVAGRQALCLMAVHDLNLAARFCSDMLVMAQGRLIARGAPGRILTPDLLRRAYGIAARVETCSLGTPLVIAERAFDPE
ncbi:ABC transporter ATP-binding protein [Pseudothauera rhizosphaerae]|uniref:ABC transporter ATP-binding protein n=1 Tax=Pseudothauera rhizosphaerae TaxID=2565932 RepID=A0A4S4AAH9_9RHOO|nr:ABC transporter ATP-binding protein [Pseudothauera rhizosphaerae]THF55631.1 ABC transporter ATP-binding protein [Pseudothauera rhizosphaerae]